MTIKTTCKCCNGTGENAETLCISDYEILPGHKRGDELAAIQLDALRCRDDHAKLCDLNPRAKDSYDRQLAETLSRLNSEAEQLIN